MIFVSKDYSVVSQSFFNVINNQASSFNTCVKLKHDDSRFFVDFSCQNDQFVDQNFYQNCNDSLYNQEVFEIFIACGIESPIRYLEIEINPNNALFVAQIHNPDKMGTHNTPVKIDCKKSGILHHAQKDKKNQCWKGELSIPIDLIQESSGMQPILDGLMPVFRVNLFRITSVRSHTDKNWKNTIDDREYSAHNSTNYHIPRFHRTDYMDLMIMKP